MSNEEFEKLKEFILSQQAQFSADIIELNTGITEIKDIVGRLANATLHRLEDCDQKIGALVDSQIRLGETLERKSADTDQQIAALVDSQIRLGETLERKSADTDQQIAALTEAQSRTDESLKKLIAVFDRNLQGRNGGSTS